MKMAQRLGLSNPSGELPGASPRKAGHITHNPLHPSNEGSPKRDFKSFVA